MRLYLTIRQMRQIPLSRECPSASLRSLFDTPCAPERRRSRARTHGGPPPRPLSHPPSSAFIRGRFPRSKLEVQRSTFDGPPPILPILSIPVSFPPLCVRLCITSAICVLRGPSVRSWTFDVRCSTFHPKSAIDHQPSTINHSPCPPLN